ncbi:MAG: hypothetical protein A2284_11785 [Deltaproteobacteria bacterium RIFOXYA12_FULL_61_11]|nr:MAG: hypothetical protein A2284_11785 [Deltaproteobacteria bacterium RIFOXYA12_FULL_61_11]
MGSCSARVRLGIGSLAMGCVLLLGCSGGGLPADQFLPPAGDASSAASAIFPHPDGFGAGAHGLVLRGEAGALETCRTCHGEDLDGGWAGTSCTSCHRTYPHTQGWIDRGRHGSFVRDNGSLLCTAACHDQDPLVAGTAGRCTGCHSDYPHTQGWSLASQHGPAATEPTARCVACHGATGGRTGDCADCHADYPHLKGWAEPAVHGAAARAGDRGTGCSNSCHGEDPQKFDKGRRCTSCHPEYPHPAGWFEAGGHGKRVGQLGGVESCATSCHGPDLERRTEHQRSCNDCHALYPHAPGWTEAAKHGASALSVGTAQCAGCHRTGTGGRSAGDCATCHAGYPHRENWADGEEHGRSGTETAQSECARCHATEGTGTASGDCHSCHADYPHPRGWEDPALHGRLPIATSCGTCHELGAGGDASGDCATCHPGFPHAEGWSDRGEHGAAYRRGGGAAACATSCHGAEYSRTEPGRTCAACHPTFPHLGTTWGSPGVHGAEYREVRRTQADAQVCGSCHDRSAEASPKRCSDCHAAYPHPAGWLSDHGPSGRGAEAAACTNSCHGPAGDRLLEGVSCRTCHSAYPHGSDWEEAARHGAEVLEAEDLEAAACGRCHAGEEGVEQEAACSGCHALYPHSQGWAEAHRREVLEHGSAGCATSCHGEDLGRSVGFAGAGRGCRDCHSLYPHPADWAEPASHGRAVSETGEVSRCATSCHGADFASTEGKQACSECHAGYPHPAGWSVGHTDHPGQECGTCHAEQRNYDERCWYCH